MAYKTPGVTVVSQFQPVVNPVSGSNRLEAIIAGVDTTNLYIYPTRTLEFRMKGLGVGAKAAIDFAFTPKPIDPLKNLAIADRIVEFSQGNTLFSRTDGTYLSDKFAEVFTLTRGTTGTDVQTGTQTTAAAQSHFTFGYGADSAKGYLYYYNPVDGTLTLCVEGTDFTVAYSDDGGKVKATVTWLDFTIVPEGAKYYGIMVYDAILSTVGTAIDGKYFAHVLPFDDTELETAANLGIVTWWPTTTSVPLDASVYYGTVRMEMPKSPQILTSPDEAIKTYGPIVNPINVDQINEPSFGAYIALAEQASSVMIVAYDKAVDSTITDALDALSATSEPKWVTSFSGSDPANDVTSPNINRLIYNHIADMSSDVAKRFRMGLIHPYDSTWSTFTTALAAYDTTTQYLDSNRNICFGPIKATVAVPVAPYGVTRRYTFNGGILGIIFGAMWSRPQYDVATSMLRKPSNTLVDLLPVLDDVKLDKFASKAVTLFAKINGRFTVRDDITSSRANLILTSEPTITMISDDIAISAVQLFDASLIGTKISVPMTYELVKASLVSLLDTKVRDGIITAYGSPIVSSDPTDPRKLLVVVPVQPTFTLKYLNITFSYVVSM